MPFMCPATLYSEHYIIFKLNLTTHLYVAVYPITGQMSHLICQLLCVFGQGHVIPAAIIAFSWLAVNHAPCLVHHHPPLQCMHGKSHDG